jgi:hypothetical protein
MIILTQLVNTYIRRISSHYQIIHSIAINHKNPSHLVQFQRMRKMVVLYIPKNLSNKKKNLLK